MKKKTLHPFYTICVITLLSLACTTLEAQNIPAPTLYRLMTAEIALDRNMPQIALSQYLSASQESQDPTIAAYATQLSVRSSDVRTALVPALLWAKKDPNNLEAQMTVIALQLRLGYIHKSIPYFTQVIKISPDAADQHFLILYQELSHETDKEAVIQALTLLEKEVPNQALSAIALSDIYLQQQQYDKALYYSEKSIKIAPQSTNAIIVYSESLRQTKSFSAATQFIEAHLSKTPNNPYIRYYLSDLYFYDKNFEKAQSNLAILAKTPQVPPEMLLQLTNLAMSQQWFPLAQQFLQKAEQYPEYQSTARYFLGRLSEAQKSLEGAITWYMQVHEGPFQTLAGIRAAILLEAKGHYQQALSVLESTSPATLGDFKRVSLTQIHIFMNMKNPNAALQVANQGLKVLGDDKDLITVREIIETTLKQATQASK